jgi:hypothetical protein
VCDAWLCDSWIFGLGIELLIVSLLMGFGGLVYAFMCRIWVEVGEEAATADRSMPAEEHTIRRTA